MCYDCSTVGSDIIVIYPSLGMNEFMIRPEVEEEDFIKDGEDEAKGVVMTESISVGRWKAFVMGRGEGYWYPGYYLQSDCRWVGEPLQRP